MFDPKQQKKNEIRLEFRGVPIIYCFVNKVNNRAYVGKTNNPWIRFKQYFSQSYIIKKLQKDGNLWSIIET